MHPAYAAGLFDGEGTLRICKDFVYRPSRPYQKYQLIASIQMTHAPTLVAIAKQWRGALFRADAAKRANPNNRIGYGWRTWSGHAAAFFADIRPYSITKADQIDLALEFQRHIVEVGPWFRKHRGNPPDLAEIHAYRDNLMAQMKESKAESFDFTKECLQGMVLVSDGPFLAA